MTDTVVAPADVDPPDRTAPDPASQPRRPRARASRGRGGWTPEIAPVLGAALQRAWRAPVQSWVSLVVVVASAALVFTAVHPELVLRDTTATGGDMGSHLWGPAYLRDHLLPQFRVTGWSPDWYAGFPAYQFYMVVPSLFVVALDVGLPGVFAIIGALAGAAVAASGFFVPALHRRRRLLLGIGLAGLVLAVPIPYNIAFKLVTVSGLVALPLAAWAFGKLTDLPFPGPPLLSVAALFFVFNREPTLNSGTGNIIGGNMASTMAGEFAFSISLAFSVLYLGVLIRGLRTGRHRGAAAALLALTGLCHLIPAFFALALSVMALVIWPGLTRLRWALPTFTVAGLLSAFWVLPFLLRHPYVNDMGWEKLPAENAKLIDGTTPQSIWHYLLGQSTGGGTRALLWPLALAVVGLAVSAVFRYRPGLLLAASTAGAAAAFAWLPQARLWNARVLPFFFLSLFLLAGVGVSEVIRALATLLARDPDRPGPAIPTVAALGCAAFGLVFIGMPLGRLPGSVYPASGGVQWLGMHRDYRNDVPGWAQWNYSGLEAKTVAGPGAKVPVGEGGWPEFSAMVDTMDRLGDDPDHGCGRAFWEYGERLETYGTPMAPMLLPYFTDSCIGSMEGLYFESSATTPYHFLSQCELSDKGSCAQRDLAYRGFDLELGLAQLELLGVKYYMAFSVRAVEAADAEARLTEVAVSGPWHIYELDADASALVTPLEYEPVVMDDVEETQDEWLDPSVAWFMDPGRWDVPLAASGPSEWSRVSVPAEPIEEKADGTKRRIGDRTLPDVPRKEVRPARVSNITSGDDEIAFDVDRAGSPVLVKASYFPNWQVSGGEGPYRVTPNLMVVIPTAEHVTLTYGRTGVDWMASGLTLLGLAGLVLLTRLAPVAMPEPLRLRRRDELGEVGEDGGPGGGPDHAGGEHEHPWWPGPAPPSSTDPVSPWTIGPHEWGNGHATDQAAEPASPDPAAPPAPAPDPDG